MSSEGLSVFERKLAERRAKQAAELAKKQPVAVPDEFADLIPEQEYEKTDADLELDRVIDSIDILDAYARWCGKMSPKVYKGQRENIMVSCPVPGHVDKNPSAWINLDKQVWHCGSCNQGGDAHDIAAFHFGYPVPAYKSDNRFGELRIKMAEDYGYRVETYPGDVTVVVGPDKVGPDSSQPQPEAPAETASSPELSPEPTAEPIADRPKNLVENPVKPEVLEGSAEVIELYDDGDLEIVSFPSMDWRAITPEGTFLYEYMQAATVDDVVEEFHFWHALLAVGFACGRQVRLYDAHPVFGNLFVCTLGRSGTGKSKAKSYLSNLLADALPHDWSDPESRGVEVLGAIASAEAMVKGFQKEVPLDPSDPKSPTVLTPVKGLIEFNELSALISRTNRAGSALKPTLMQFYDMEPVISTTSITHGKKEAKYPFGSALTTSQPLSLKELVGRADDNSGFLNRWVFIGGPEKKKFAIGGVRVDMTPAVLPLQKIAGWGVSFGDDEFVQWSPEAVETFSDFFYNRIEVDKTGPNGSLLTRIDLLMKKLILLLSANKHERVVTRQTVEEAIHCYPYLTACYGVPAAQIGNTLQNEISEAILYQVRKQYEIDKRGASLSQIARALKRRKYPHDILLKTIDSLTKLGYLEAETSRAGVRGRPTVRYLYVE